jgi:hypothetical protein
VKLTKSTLKQIIQEELKKALQENPGAGHGFPYPWERTRAAEEAAKAEELPAEFQYERILDELVDAARDAIMPLAVEKLKEVGALSEEEGRGLTYNDLELEIEEPLLDALKPLAKLIQAKVDHAPDRETEEEEEW